METLPSDWVVPVLEHRAVELAGTSAHATRAPAATRWGVRFDGGSRTRLGSGGFAVWDE